MSIKLCKDCLNVRGTDQLGCWWTCSAIVVPSLVDGLDRLVTCEIERTSINGSCGPDGKLWKERKAE